MNALIRESFSVRDPRRDREDTIKSCTSRQCSYATPTLSLINTLSSVGFVLRQSPWPASKSWKFFHHKHKSTMSVKAQECFHYGKEKMAQNGFTFRSRKRYSLFKVVGIFFLFDDKDNPTATILLPGITASFFFFLPDLVLVCTYCICIMQKKKIDSWMWFVQQCYPLEPPLTGVWVWPTSNCAIFNAEGVWLFSFPLFLPPSEESMHERAFCEFLVGSLVSQRYAFSPHFSVFVWGRGWGILPVVPTLGGSNAIAQFPHI